MHSVATAVVNIGIIYSTTPTALVFQEHPVSIGITPAMDTTFVVSKTNS